MIKYPVKVTPHDFDLEGFPNDFAIETADVCWIAHCSTQRNAIIIANALNAINEFPDDAKDIEKEPLSDFDTIAWQVHTWYKKFFGE